ncbi:hypothetical protein BT67DRAFT_185333 [Trichocladium antarcticum]|uniref:Uncharacterized protein n=1 Tax=Trichocladium antarcticum TaxID=1450529 RepID=A0AAN6ZG50_9PEZI|nr:hypothetical protein BT67DRAFT_185333 [Trichocladium antarcticum]
MRSLPQFTTPRQRNKYRKLPASTLHVAAFLVQPDNRLSVPVTAKGGYAKKCTLVFSGEGEITMPPQWVSRSIAAGEILVWPRHGRTSWKMSIPIVWRRPWIPATSPMKLQPPSLAEVFGLSVKQSPTRLWLSTPAITWLITYRGMGPRRIRTDVAFCCPTSVLSSCGLGVWSSRNGSRQKGPHSDGSPRPPRESDRVRSSGMVDSLPVGIEYRRCTCGRPGVTETTFGGRRMLVRQRAPASNYQTNKD